MKTNMKEAKIKLKQINIVLQFVLLIVIFCFLYHFSKHKEKKAKKQATICEKYFESQFSGIVDYCFIDHSKKGRHYFRIKDSSDTLRMWYYGTYGLAIGDSIVKEKGKPEYVIYKKQYSDSILVLKFSCK